MKSVAIIGAGIGGLCTGIGLLCEGYEVSIYEKTDAPGGVLRSITSPDGAFRFEESASIPINPDTYSDFFQSLGLNPAAYVQEKRLKTLYHIYYPDGKVLRLPHDLGEMRAELQRHFSKDVDGWEAFLNATMHKYQIAKRHFLTQPFLTASSTFRPQTLCKLAELNPFSSASRYVSRFIQSEELQNCILFQAFFMGIPPEKLPNVYTTIYANSQVEGIGQIQGGLSQYASGLARLFTDRGGTLFYQSPAEQILGEGNTATALQINGKPVKAGIFVVNADYCYAQRELLHRKLHRYSQPSCSTYVLHLGLTKKHPELGVHNLFINEHFREEITGIFHGRLPQTPSLYLYSPSCVDNSYCKNPAHSVLNLMVRVPNLKSLPIAWDSSTREQLGAACLKAASSIKGLESIQDEIAYRTDTTPVCFQQRYNYQYGSCFGIGHTLFQSMALRPQLRDKVYRNLYYTGSSIHPGNGASIVIEGAKMTIDAIRRTH